MANATEELDIEKHATIKENQQPRSTTMSSSSPVVLRILQLGAIASELVAGENDTQQTYRSVNSSKSCTNL